MSYPLSRPLPMLLIIVAASGIESASARSDDAAGIRFMVSLPGRKRQWALMAS
jgi:hypothetical protein